MNAFDQGLLPVLNRGAANSVLDWLMPRITNLHQQKLFWAAALIVCLMVFWKGARSAKIGVVCALLAVGLSDLTAARIVKNLVPRDRPCAVRTVAAMRGAAVRLVPGTHCPGSNSFPSNHASNMMALATVAFWFTRGRARWLWFLLPLVIGYSRVYLGFHYPTDVVGGWALGALIGGLMILTVRSRVREPSDTPADSPSVSTAESADVPGTEQSGTQSSR